MKNAFIKLFSSIKKIIALLLTLVFCFLSATGRIETKDFIQIFIIIISFYYGQSTAKSSQPEVKQ